MTMLNRTQLRRFHTLTKKGKDGPITVGLERDVPTGAELRRAGITHTFQARLNARVYGKHRRIVGQPGDLLAEFLSLRGALSWCENEGVVIETRKGC